MLKRLLLSLTFLMMAQTAIAGYTGVVSRSATRDTVPLVFAFLDSVGNNVAGAVGDSIYLIVADPGGDEVYRDSTLFAGVGGLIPEDQPGVYVWSRQISVIDGTSTDEGIFSYTILAVDISLALRTTHIGYFQIVNNTLDETLDSLLLAIRDGASGKNNFKATGFATTGDIATLSLDHVALALQHDSIIDTTNAIIDIVNALPGIDTLSTVEKDALVDLIWDEILTGATHNINNSSGKRLRAVNAQIITSGTAQSGGSTYIKLAASTAFADDFLNGSVITLIGGTGLAQERTIEDYTGATDSATLHVGDDWITDPASDTDYEVKAGHAGEVNHIHTAALDSIAYEVWEEINTGATHNTTNSTGKQLRGTADVGSTFNGVLDSVGTNYVYLPTGAETDSGAYDPSRLHVAKGLGKGQTFNILQYDGIEMRAWLDRDIKAALDNTSEIYIMPDPGREHVNEGASQGGTSTTIILNALASDLDGMYVGQGVFLRSGPGADQWRRVIGYVGSTRTATINGSPWLVTPTDSTCYVMLPTGTFDMAAYAQEIRDSVWSSGYDAALQSLTVSNPNGDAVQFTSTGNNGSGMQMTGFGFGSGMTLFPGSTGNGFSSRGGVTSGHAMFLNGFIIGHGLYTLGGSTSGDGFHTEAVTDGDGIETIGVGSGLDVNGEIVVNDTTRNGNLVDTDTLSTANLLAIIDSLLKIDSVAINLLGTATSFGQLLMNPNYVQGAAGTSDTANIIDAFLRLVAADTVAATMWSKLMVMIDSTETAIADANKSNFMADVSALALEASLYDPATDSVIVDGSEFERVTWARQIMTALGYGETPEGYSFWSKDRPNADVDTLFIGWTVSAGVVDTLAAQMIWHPGGTAGDPPNDTTTAILWP